MNDRITAIVAESLEVKRRYFAEHALHQTLQPTAAASRNVEKKGKGGGSISTACPAIKRSDIALPLRGGLEQFLLFILSMHLGQIPRQTLEQAHRGRLVIDVNPRAPRREWRP